MTKPVVLIVWVEERLDSIWTVDCSIGNVILRIPQKIINNTLFHK